MKHTLTRLLFAIWLALLAVLAFPALVFAADATPTDPAGPIVETDTLASVRLSAIVVMAIVSVFLPLLVGLVTTIKDHPFAKGFLNIVVTAIAALIVQSQLADGTLVLSQQTFFVWLIGLGATLVGYYQVWKPLKLTSSTVLVPGSNHVPVAVPGKLASVGLRK